MSIRTAAVTLLCALVVIFALASMASPGAWMRGVFLAGAIFYLMCGIGAALIIPRPTSSEPKEVAK